MMMYELRGSNAVHDILYLFFFQSSFFNVFCFTSFLEDFFSSVTHYSFLKVFTKNFKLRCFYFWRPETGSAGDFTYSLPGSCAIKFNMADNVQFLDLTPSNAKLYMSVLYILVSVKKDDISRLIEDSDAENTNRQRKYAVSRMYLKNYPILFLRSLAVTFHANMLYILHFLTCMFGSKFEIKIISV